MTKTMVGAWFVVVGLAAGCAGRAVVVVTPEQKQAALTMYLGGATSQQVGEELALGPAVAREVIHTTIVELNRRYYREH